MALTEVTRTRVNRAPTGPVEYIVEYNGSDPVATAEIDEAVPAGKLWKLLAVYVKLVTNATPANRAIRLQITDGTNKRYEVSDDLHYAENLTGETSFVLGQQTKSNLLTGLHVVRLFDAWLQPGTHIETLTSGKQTGDNYAAPKFIVLEREVA